jgi:hypothetical protein
MNLATKRNDDVIVLVRSLVGNLRILHPTTRLFWGVWRKHISKTRELQRLAIDLHISDLLPRLGCVVDLMEKRLDSSELADVAVWNS